MRKFTKVNIEISNICNLQCSFCPEVIREKKMMSLELFRRCIEQVAPLTEMVCFHLMGDPLVHPQLDQLIDVCDTFKTKIFFVTNGVLLRAEKVESLLRSPFYQINFSVHSFFDNFPDRDPSTYLETIFSFVDRAMLERPELYLNFRLWNLSEDKSGEKNLQMLEAICNRYHAQVPTSVDVTKKKSFHLKNRLYLHFDSEFIWPALDLPILGTRGRCQGLSNHFGILVDGTVVPCCLDKEAAIPLGKIQDTPVLDILQSEKAQGILQGFKNGQLKENLCQRCQYIERFKV